MRNLIMCLALFSLGAPPAAVPQAPPPLTPGSLIRVQVDTHGSPRWIQGTLVSAAVDSVLLVRAGHTDTLAFATGSLTRVETSAERRNRAGHGALVGGAIGAGLGLAIGIAAAAEDCSGFCAVESGEGTMATAAVILGVLGTAVGGAIGSVSHSERWVRVTMPIALGATRGRRLGVAITIPFGSAHPETPPSPR
jgi:hypothetical protein